MAAVTKAPSFMLPIKRICYNLAGFNQYGLFSDDILYENDDVKEALKRLPKKVVDERNYRLLRAVQASIQKVILPKSLWTTYDENIKNQYLTPIVDQVIKEREEKEAWTAKY